MNFERIFLDEWMYVPLLMLVCVVAFGLGMCVGTVWALLL
jgi:hypothetical protein